MLALSLSLPLAVTFLLLSPASSHIAPVDLLAPRTAQVSAHDIIHALLPQPTASPPIPRELLHRQTDEDDDDDDDEPVDGIIAPDRTCGYVSGSVGAHRACSIGSICSFLHTITPGVVVCCSETEDSCQAKFRCLDNDEAIDPDICDAACQNDAFTRKCTARSFPLCRTYRYPLGIQEYECVGTGQDTFVSVQFTYTGQDGRTLTTTDDIFGVVDTTTTSDPVAPITTESETSTPPAPSSPTSASSSPSPTPTSSSSSSSSPPIGPIVGGAVGGVAIIGIVIVLIVFLRRRRSPDPPQPQPQQQHQPQSPPQPQFHPAPSPASPGSPYQAEAKGYVSPPTFSPPTYSQPGSPIDPRASIMSGSTLGSPVHPGAPTGLHQPYQPPGTIGPVFEADNTPADHHRGALHEAG